MPNFAPTYNLAPTDPIPIVRHDPGAGSRNLVVARWGLIPYWAKDIKIGYSTFNARCEDVENRPTFREAFRRRRCLVLSMASTSGRSSGRRRSSPTQLASRTVG